MSIILNAEKTEQRVSITEHDVVVIGAGPYGLSVASHLAARGLKVAIFGKPLQLWREHMPNGMYLRSYWWATSLSDPKGRYSFEKYFETHRQQGHDPLSRETFINYAMWFQEQAVPDVDQTYVELVTRENGYFRVQLVDGRVIHSRVVVMAPGLNYYVYRPEIYQHLSSHLVSHTSEFSSFEQFASKKVVMIGGGQAALEDSALLHESGASVEIITRRKIRWLPAPATKRTLVERIKRPQAGTGPGWLDWSLEHLPYAFWLLSRVKKDELLSTTYTPAGADWLKDRVLNNVILHEGQNVQEVKEVDNRVELVLVNGETIQADHVMLGTGYHIDVKKLPMLHPSLTASIKTYRDAPVLKQTFETNIPGLYFVGISAVSSFGPLYRFVIGTKSTARQVARSVGSALVRSK